MPYDPSAFPPFAVTVDLVVLTVRRHSLCALAVRRGEPPFQGRWALP
ncbi:DNA hydrolase, partial [Streptomyces sp. 4F]